MGSRVSKDQYNTWVDMPYAAINKVEGDARRARIEANRKAAEGLPPDAYEKMTYYERWIFSITQALQYNGLLTTEELSLKMEDVHSRYETETA